MRGGEGGVSGRGVCGIRSMTGRYASYWNAFLLSINSVCSLPIIEVIYDLIFDI